MRIERIAEVIDQLGGKDLAAIESRLSTLSPMGTARRFVINRMGSTGSTWVAKLLNSHPDVFCSHEGVLRRTLSRPADNSQLLEFIEAIALHTMHDAYLAIGDVGSVWAGHAASLTAFTTGLLVRHPARLLHSRLFLYPTDPGYSEVASIAEIGLRQLWGIEVHQYDAIDRAFLQDAFVYACQAWTHTRVNVLVRIEGMRNPAYCHKMLYDVTGVDYPEALIIGANQKRVNPRTACCDSIADIVARFSARQREWYELLLRDTATGFEYDLWDDES